MSWSDKVTEYATSEQLGMQQTATILKPEVKSITHTVPSRVIRPLLQASCMPAAHRCCQSCSLKTKQQPHILLRRNQRCRNNYAAHNCSVSKGTWAAQDQEPSAGSFHPRPPACGLADMAHAQGIWSAAPSHLQSLLNHMFDGRHGKTFIQQAPWLHEGRFMQPWRPLRRRCW
jgi:hypothetical protein